MNPVAPAPFNASLLATLIRARVPQTVCAAAAADQPADTVAAAAALRQMAAALAMAGLPIESHAAMVAAAALPIAAAAPPRRLLVEAIGTQILSRLTGTADSPVLLWPLANAVREASGQAGDDPAIWCPLEPDWAVVVFTEQADAQRAALAEAMGERWRTAAPDALAGMLSTDLRTLRAQATRPWFHLLWSLALARLEIQPPDAAQIADMADRLRMEVHRWSHPDAHGPQQESLRAMWQPLLMTACPWPETTAPVTPAARDVETWLSVAATRAVLARLRRDPHPFIAQDHRDERLDAVRAAWTGMSSDDPDGALLWRAVLGLQPHLQAWPHPEQRAAWAELEAAAADAARDPRRMHTEDVALEGALLFNEWADSAAPQGEETWERLRGQRERFAAARRQDAVALRTLPRLRLTPRQRQRATRLVRQRVFEVTDDARAEAERRIEVWRLGDGLFDAPQRQALARRWLVTARVVTIMGHPLLGRVLTDAAERMAIETILERPPTADALAMLTDRWSDTLGVLATHLHAVIAGDPEARRFLEPFRKLDTDNRDWAAEARADAAAIRPQPATLGAPLPSAPTETYPPPAAADNGSGAVPSFPGPQGDEQVIVGDQAATVGAPLPSAPTKTDPPAPADNGSGTAPSFPGPQKDEQVVVGDQAATVDGSVQAAATSADGEETEHRDMPCSRPEPATMEEVVPVMDENPVSAAPAPEDVVPLTPDATAATGAEKNPVTDVVPSPEQDAALPETETETMTTDADVMAVFAPDAQPAAPPQPDETPSRPEQGEVPHHPSLCAAFEEEVAGVLETLDRRVHQAASVPDSLDVLGVWDEIVRLFHTLKGTGRLVGYTRASNVAARLEATARAARRPYARYVGALASTTRWWHAWYDQPLGANGARWADTTSADDIIAQWLSVPAAPPGEADADTMAPGWGARPPLPLPTAPAPSHEPVPAMEPAGVPTDGAVPTASPSGNGGADAGCSDRAWGDLVGTVTAWLEQGERLLAALETYDRIRPRHREHPDP